MKKNILLFLFLGILLTEGFSQQVTSRLRLKDAIVSVAENVSTFNWKVFTEKHLAVNGKRVAVMVFDEVPGELTRKQLVNAGIRLGDYIPDHAYIVSIDRPLDKALLIQMGIKSIVDLPAGIKLDGRLQQNKLPTYAITTPGTIDVLVNINKGFTVAEAIQQMLAMGYEVTDQRLAAHHIVTVRLPQSKLQAIASSVFIDFIQPVSPKDKTLNDELTHNARSNVLNAPISAGGENLQGKDVVIGIGDFGDITSHVDLNDRVIERTGFIYQNHATQVAGSAAGAGIREEQYKGVAPRATIVSQLFGGIYLNAEKYVTDYGMVVTNNSYGAIDGDCQYAGVYDLYSKVLDNQAFSLPKLLHVFAGGNDGYVNCSGYPGSYRTVLGGYQSSKNILSVGWGEKIPIASNHGSHGPTADGRIDPQMTAAGSEVRSPGINNSYVTDYGSSLSAPAVAGGATLLIEKYRQLNAGADPESGLVKALLMNGAVDSDNPGPDYKGGYGYLNLNRSVAMLKESHFIKGSIATGQTIDQPITVPAGTGQVKVMVYWHDPSAAVFASAALVNDLDLQLIAPGNNTLLPWILDSSAANMLNDATRGEDHINNQEQVTLLNPATGNYTIRIKGTAINSGVLQEYFIVYDFLPATIKLTYPSVGDALMANEVVLIFWDAWDNSANSFTLQLTTDNGANWTDVNNNIPATQKYLMWTVPNISTGLARMRISRNGTSLTNESNVFAIMPRAGLSISTTRCEGYFPIQWTSVTNATDYEVFLKKGSEMVSIATTTGNNYVLSGLNKDSVYWMSVRPRINGMPGRRSTAVSLQPNQGTCAGNISDNDLKLDSIISPVVGRKQTSSEITVTTLRVRVKNLDDVAVNNFEVKYSVNGGPFISESGTAPIAPQGTYIHTFTGLSFSAAGDYNIIAIVKNSTTDAVTKNDTLSTTIRQLSNAPITLPFSENFETAPVFEVKGNSTGLPGLNRWDLQTSSPNGRVRSFVNSGIALNGNRALTLDVSRYVEQGNTNYLIGTFNFENYSYSFPDELGLVLDFWYKHHGQSLSPNNRVWLRSSDTSSWIEVFNLDSAQGLPGEWKKVGPIHIANVAGLIQPTSSFQVRIGQKGILSMSDENGNAGITIDSLRFFTNSTDFALLRIDTPIVKSCGLSNQVPLKIFVANYRPFPFNIPVYYSLDGGAPVMEMMPFGSESYTFNQRLDLSAPGKHTIVTWVSFNQDNDKSNDTVRITITNQPLISSFPYLENFENGSGNWYAEGRNSSWELGTPNSLKIKTAASGTKAWKTSLRGTYNDDELSYLYSPCFDVSALANPWLSLSLAMDIEQCTEVPCDQVWIEYSRDGKQWTKLAAKGQGVNWYNRPGDNVWDSSGFVRWHSAGVALPVGLSTIQLRVVMKSDAALIKEGVAVDDIHIYDRQLEIYTGPSITTPVMQTPAANSWTRFTSSGKVIADINANGNSLGNTGVQVFIHNGGSNNVRYTNGQYFLDRSITLKPTNITHSDSTSIRMYFTDAEVDSLVKATNCAGCSKPADAYRLGVTKYDDADDSKENGELFDNLSGMYSFIQSSKVIKVPYDAGYYAEFKVKDFSEFWLNNGGVTGNLPLPILLSNFNAVKQNKDVLVQWTALNENDIERYEVEIARTTSQFNSRQFEMLETVLARNASQSNYRITDVEANKTGARYYRLKIIDKTGQVRYSEVKVVVFDSRANWMVYPNPVRDVLQVVAQANAGDKIEVQLMNVAGQLLINKSAIATGFADKIQLNVGSMKLPAGVYVVKISSGEEVKQIRVVKE